MLGIATRRPAPCQCGVSAKLRNSWRMIRIWPRYKFYVVRLSITLNIRAKLVTDNSDVLKQAEQRE